MGLVKIFLGEVDPVCLDTRLEDNPWTRGTERWQQNKNYEKIKTVTAARSVMKKLSPDQAATGGAGYPPS
jgi:hypothetical protein